MVRLPGVGLRKALDFMLDVTAAGEPEAVVRCAIEGLPRLVASEVTTLSVCDLAAGTRRVVSFPGDAIAAGDRATFDRLIHDHPLVRYHSSTPNGGARRISDCVSDAAFRRHAIFGEYYQRLGIDRVIAVPVVAGPGHVMSYVLNRKGLDFSDGERDLLDALRPALANLYRFAMLAGDLAFARPRATPLTPREEEVLRWVCAGKTDLQVAAILGASVRTVQKHLENVYVKLGVENRTAAAMRFEDLRRRAIRN
jgi:DNA-binding CsgD family transcriptional regulator